MRSERDVQITTGLGIFLFILFAAYKGPDFYKEILSIASSAISATVAIRLVFVRWLWKFTGKICNVPLLEGTWKGSLQSTGNEKTPENRKQVEIELRIQQPHINTIKVTRISDESTSRSSGETLEVAEDGTVTLGYTFLSEPNALVRERSPMSYGTARLTLKRDIPPKLEGNYWTDQKTTGFLSVTKQERKR